MYTPWVWLEREKGSNADYDKALRWSPQLSCLPFPDLEPLLDLKRMGRWGGSGSGVTLMHAYTNTPILITNSIIHPEIENPSYPSHQ